ncbi:MAG: FHA domain-containing protein [Thermoleophilaceae bacterium]
MGSTNGTYLNGRQVRGAERLKEADVIRIGDTEYRYGE